MRCLFEYREGDLWVGSNSGLTRFRDTMFVAYGKSEGLPSYEPNAVFQDHAGRIWVGFHDSGLMLLSGGQRRVFTIRDGLPNNEIFSIHEAANGDLLIGARGGMVRMHNGTFETFVPRDPLARINVFDALEDSGGRIWMATPGGLVEKTGRSIADRHPRGAGAFQFHRHPVLRRRRRLMGRHLREGALAHTGRIRPPVHDLRRPLERPDPLAPFRHGWHALDRHLRRRAGCAPQRPVPALHRGQRPSQRQRCGCHGRRRIALVEHHAGESAGLPWAQLREFDEGRRKTLEPANYGMEDGLRSAQCSPSYPMGGGGYRTNDGRLWFTTSRGLAVYNPGRTNRRRCRPWSHRGTGCGWPPGGHGVQRPLGPARGASRSAIPPFT